MAVDAGGIPPRHSSIVHTIRCDIVSAEADIYHGQATLVVASGEAGELGIAPHHEPLLTRLKPGHIDVVGPDGSHHLYYVSGGILEVQPAVVTVLADTALRTDQIDQVAAQRAKAEAEHILAGRVDPRSVEQAHAELCEAVAELETLARAARLRAWPYRPAADARRGVRAIPETALADTAPARAERRS